MFNADIIHKIIDNSIKGLNVSPSIQQCINYREYKKILKAIKNEKVKSQTESKKRKAEIDNKNLINERKNMLMSSGIDLSRLGWVAKVSALWGVSSIHVRRFISKYLKNLNFYRRKAPITERSSKPYIIP